MSAFFTTKPVGEGTGLGLSISHDIVVKQHGGSIEVDTQPGEFTVFLVEKYILMLLCKNLNFVHPRLSAFGRLVDGEQLCLDH